MREMSAVLSLFLFSSSFGRPANLVVPALRCMAEWFSCFNLGAPLPGMVGTYAALLLLGLDLPCIEESKPLSLNRPQDYVGWRQAVVGRRCLDYVRGVPCNVSRDGQTVSQTQFVAPGEKVFCMMFWDEASSVVH